MKNRIFIIVASMLLITSCTDNDGIKLPQDEVAQVVSTIRSPQDAVDAAKSALANLNPTSRSSQLVKGVEYVQPIYSKTSRSGNNEPVIYVVPCEEEGFVLVSAPVDAPDVLAVVEDGDFNSEETLNNEGFQQHLNSTIALISRLPINPIPVTPVTPIETGKMDTTDVNKKSNKKLAVEWNQGWPEGLYAPYKIAGCVPVGIAQMMSYFAMSTTITYTYSGRTLNSETINWTALKKHKRSCHSGYGTSERNSHASHCQATDAAHLMLARLCRQIGEYAYAEYAEDETTVTPDNALRAMKKYIAGKNITTITDQNELQEKLFDGGVAGIGMNTNGILTGHFWVADGAWTFGRIITYTGPEIRETPPDQPIEPIVTFEMSNTVKNYVHYNWGWGGNCNGYFLVGINNPDNSYYYDNPELSNSMGTNYNINRIAYYVK